MLTAHSTSLRLVAAALLASALAPAQTAAGSEAPEREPALVVVIGASVSAGFVDPLPREDGERNRTVPLRSVLTGMWTDGDADVRDRSDLMTFLDPAGHQGRKLERLVEDRPALVLGLDYPFWFGYGHVRSDEERLELQQKGLALLDGVEGPIVLGDYPDMTGADQRMLSPRQIPGEESLAALNRGLREWAAARKNVHVFPLAEWVTRMKSEGAKVRYEDREITLTTKQLMQGDLLHASKLGMAVLGHQLALFLEGALPEDHPLRPATTDFADFVKAADAEFEMDEAIEALERDAEPVEAGAGDGKR